MQLLCVSLFYLTLFYFLLVVVVVGNTTNRHLFVHSFNNVLRILFAINELSLLVPLYTYLYLNKTISDKEPSLVCVCV